MSPRTSARLARSAWALSAAFVLLSVPLYWSTSPSAVLLDVPQIVAVLALAALVLAFSTVGALIVARRPGNGVGWILCAAGLSIGATTLASGYAVFSLAGPSRVAGDGVGRLVRLLNLGARRGSRHDVRAPAVPRRAASLTPLEDRGLALPGCTGDARLRLGLHARASERLPGDQQPAGARPARRQRLGKRGFGWALLPTSVVLSAVSIAVRYRRSTGEKR
jgi:hypothetical protein